MSSRTRDRGYIDVLAHYLNRRQAAKIRDASNVVTLHVRLDSGIEYWIRGVDEGIWVYAKGNGGGFMWSRIVDHGRLSTLLDTTTNHEIIHNYDDVPGRIRQGPKGGTDT